MRVETPSGAKCCCGDLADPLGVLERRRGRQHHDVGRAAQLREPAVQGLVVLTPLATTDERERAFGGRRVAIAGEHYRAAPLANRTYRSVACPLSIHGEQCRNDQAGRNRRFGDHGQRHRRGRRQGGHRGGAAEPFAGHGRRDGRRAREVARQAGGAGQARRRRAHRRARPGHRGVGPRCPRRLRPRDRVDRRGPPHEEAPLQRARPHRAPTAGSSPPTRRRCPSSRWRWRRVAPSSCAASTSSTRRR